MIGILLASYNGAKYIETQIESILGQDNNDWHLFIRDDNSDDGTRAILIDYKAKYPDKIDIELSAGRDGAAGNFFTLIMEHNDLDYLMLCDQDDIWLPSKVSNALWGMKRMEKRFGNIPLLYAEDATVYNEAGHENVSLAVFQKLDPSMKSFNKLLGQNNFTGCTFMMNKALASYFTCIPEFCIMHDYWIALTAACFGFVGYRNTSNMLYRQHGDNVEGAKDHASFSAVLKKSLDGKSIKAALAKNYAQAMAFKKMYDRPEYGMSAENRRTLNAFIKMKDMSKADKIKVINKFGFTKSGLARKIGYYIYI